MNSKKLYFIMLTIVGLLAICLLGGAYGANMLLQSQAQDVVQARSKTTALEQQQVQLTRAKASIAKYQDVAKIAKSIVPQDKDQAQAVRELVKIAEENGVKLGTITFPSSTLGATAAPAAGAATTPAAGATPAPAAAGAANLSQLKPAPGITGVYTMQITAQSDTTNTTPYNQFVSFLDALERNRRTALVSAITLQPDPKDPSRVSFTLTIDEYIKP